jgi:GAF domain-containing protein
VGEEIMKLQLPLRAEDPDRFSLAIKEERYTTLSLNELDDLPDDFKKAFQPTSPLAVVPLKARDQVIGLLVADNKFTKTPILEEMESLLALANTAAITIDNKKLLHQVQRARKAAGAVARLTTLGDYNTMLASVVQRTQEAVGCDAVTLYVYDQITQRLHHPPEMVGVYYPEKVQQFERVAPDSIIYTILQLDEPHVAANVADDTYLKRTRFARDEGIKSCLAIPLKVARQKVGVMFVNYRNSRCFIADELNDIELFADQAAIAIHNAQLYMHLQKRAEALHALYEAGGVVTSSLDLGEILDHIAEQAWHVTTGRNCNKGYAEIWLVEDVKAELKTVYPKKFLDKIRPCFPQGIDLKLISKERMGVIKKTIFTGEAQLVADVNQEIDYIRLSLESCSELVVPIKSDGKVIGVINVEYFDTKLFDEQDKNTLEALAIQASMAIKIARQYEAQKIAQALIAARTSLAWMGMASSTALHTISNKATTIQDLVALLRRDLKWGKAIADLEKRLNTIHTVAANILDTPITALSPTGTDVGLVPINDLVRERIGQLWQREPYKLVDIQFETANNTSLTVRANPEWLKRALTILIDNAVQAMDGCATKNFTVNIYLRNKQVEIYLTDTGPGIPEDIMPKILQEPIEKDKEAKGLGMGLLMAQTIVQAYGGTISLESTDPSGTTMVIRLPIIG